MLSGETTFTMKEIKDLLQGESLVPGTDAYQEAIRKRFIPTEMHNDQGEMLYMES